MSPLLLIVIVLNAAFPEDVANPQRFCFLRAVDHLGPIAYLEGISEKLESLDQLQSVDNRRNEL